MPAGLADTHLAAYLGVHGPVEDLAVADPDDGGGWLGVVGVAGEVEGVAGPKADHRAAADDRVLRRNWRHTRWRRGGQSRLSHRTEDVLIFLQWSCLEQPVIQQMTVWVSLCLQSRYVFQRGQKEKVSVPFVTSQRADLYKGCALRQTLPRAVFVFVTSSQTETAMLNIIVGKHD